MFLLLLWCRTSGLSIETVQKHKKSQNVGFGEVQHKQDLEAEGEREQFSPKTATRQVWNEWNHTKLIKQLCSLTSMGSGNLNHSVYSERVNFKNVP